MAAAAAAAVPGQLHLLSGGAVEKKQVYFEYAKLQWETDQVGENVFIGYGFRCNISLEACVHLCVLHPLLYLAWFGVFMFLAEGIEEAGTCVL
jgi:hypothetical protein